MLILFSDIFDGTFTLACVNADAINYDCSDSTLCFSVLDDVWFAHCELGFAESCIRTVYQNGRIDLSDVFFKTYEA